MRIIFKTTVMLAMLLTAACVTVNIYFPAAEVQKDAERVVKEAYGIEVTPPKEGSWLSPDLLEFFGPTTAYAADYVNLTNAATRGLEAQLTANTQQLASFFASGAVGLDNDGFAILRDKGGLDMQAVGQVNRLVAADRSIKGDLYMEKAKAAGTPDKVGEVQQIYADLWKKYAAPGTYIQSGGGWSQK
ncbi:MAG: YdbL family protein [Proteobacteria bacterium]|nr:YdbL family protein [Pseudomonadota bacterium]MBU1611290.1 YdbL family protein [Pseudomonadota bacterium]